MRKVLALGAAGLGAALLVVMPSTAVASVRAPAAPAAATAAVQQIPPGFEWYIDVETYDDCERNGDAGIERFDWVEYLCVPRDDGWWRLYVREA